MEEGDTLQRYLGRLSEAQICLEQGLDENAVNILEDILAEVERDDFPQEAKVQIRDRAQSMLNRSMPEVEVPRESVQNDGALDPVQFFDYGLALMDGQFWPEAIQEFGTAAELGFKPLECWEKSGDCSAKLEKWDEAIGFFNRIYSREDVPEERKKSILLKITNCSQKRSRSSSKLDSTLPPSSPEFVNFSISSLDAYSINSMMGQTASSWPGVSGNPANKKSRSYRLTNLLHVGSSSLTVELEDEESGKKFAGQTLTGPFGNLLSPEKLAAWVNRQVLINSPHLVKLYDLANINECYFIVREHLPLSLNDLLTAGKTMPIPVAIRLAYQVLEAIGDLHLHMGADGKVYNQFHLDLRPSRVLLSNDKPVAKLYNGGLWKELENTAPDTCDPRRLPPPHLSYRASEQFRPYLLRKRPPIPTDIYLFGTLFYEILTGMPAFKASSYEEYEIQHCEQYPTPPKVWRPQISDVINELIMKCLDSDPIKRWRSTSQVSIILEKAFPREVSRPKDDLYRNYLEELKLV